MNVSRRWFIGGAASFGALSGCRAFRAPTGLFSGDGAKLTLGVISDIHIDCGRGDFRKFGDASQFEKALRWFDARGVDGVVVAGDLADNGMINQLECVGEAWFRVFPDGRAGDGRPVEQLFVYGNHDLEGQNYDQFGFRYFEKKSFAAGQIVSDPGAAWQRVFHEPYAPIWHKRVKGYDFVGAHWGKTWKGIPEVEDWFAENGATLDPKKPFFFIQHPHPKDTVYAEDVWGADAGYATRALSKFPNAIAISGHSHDSLTDERSVWQGAFTSIGASSLRYGGHVDKYEQRQGLLVRAYDDRLVIERRDFLHEKSLGDDWVIPLNGEQPFDFGKRRRETPPPAFAGDAKLGLAVEKDGYRLVIPPANAGKTRAFKYLIETDLVDEKTGKPLVIPVYDSKYNMNRSEATVPTVRCVGFDRLPKGADGQPQKPNFSVVPVNWFGTRGKPIRPEVG